MTDSRYDSKFVITVDRADQGKATIILWKHLKNGGWKELATAKHGGWDDAIPWPIGTYDGNARTDRFGFDAWHLNTGFTDRVGIDLHVKLGSAPKSVPISYSSFGCIVAEGAFIKKVDKKIGNKDVDFQIRGIQSDLRIDLDVR